MLETLHAASDVFSQQAAPPNSSSALQSTFLIKVVAIVEDSNRHSGASITPDRRNRQLLDQQLLEPDADTRRLGHLEDISGSLDTTTSHDVNQFQEAVEQGNDLLSTPQSQTLNFFDDEMWSTIFANAGFSISDGVFIPESGGC